MPRAQREQTIAALPGPVLKLVKRALERRPVGVLALGSPTIQTHNAMELVTAAVLLTDAMGPAVRIRPRTRSTPAKEMPVPDPVKALPMLASVESAYAQGYRRMLIETRYTKPGSILPFHDVLFITGMYGLEVSDFLLHLSSFENTAELLERVIALVGIASVEGTRKGSSHVLSDVYLPQPLTAPLQRSMEIFDVIQSSRAVKWEDEARRLLEAGEVDTAAMKRLIRGSASVSPLLADWERSTKGATAY